MAGPFPGMDPYLEARVRWAEAHNMFIIYMVEALNSLLPMPYVAGAEQRCYIDRSENEVRPDIIVRESPPISLLAPGNTAVLDAADPALLFRIHPLEEREAYIDIVHVEENSRVVTTIELLSHTNKTTRDEGRRLYLKKQQGVLASRTHLLELDLLRSGRHTVAIPKSAFRPEHKPEHKYDYLVCLHRAGHGEEYQVWPNTLRQRLPRIAVPLEEEVPDIIFDLQIVLDRTYNGGAYSRKIDYRQEPVPPLEGEDAAWAEALLRERKLRE